MSKCILLITPMMIANYLLKKLTIADKLLASIISMLGNESIGIIRNSDYCINVMNRFVSNLSLDFLEKNFL